MQVLQQLPEFTDPRLLVGGETADDAGVYRVADELALVLTVDVLTPIADDPYVFGQIAAANSLSDVYAMGGRPVVALNIIAFPVGEIGHETIRAILAGVRDKVREAGAVIAGGHTLKDSEVKCGLAVTGLVHPDRVVRNVGANPGDVLILTKPLGIGIITTALRANLASREAVAAANRVMSQLNRTAAAVMVEVGVNAATDVTGFGLLGHAWEMAQSGGIDILIHADRVPIIAEAIELARQSLFPVGSLKNYSFIRERADFAAGVTEELRLLLCDAQTAGGLLMAVAAERKDRLLDRLLTRGVEAATVIGEVVVGNGRLQVC